MLATRARIFIPVWTYPSRFLQHGPALLLPFASYPQWVSLNFLNRDTSS